MPKVLIQKEVVTETQLNDGTVEEQRAPVFVFAHCYNVVCRKYHNLQAGLNHEYRVPGIREETQYTYADRGGDMPGHENSHVRWFPQDDANATCEACGEPMNVSDSPSRKLQQYGVGPGYGLKGAEKAAAEAALQVREAQTDEVDDLKSQIAELTKVVGDLAKKRPPGRPPGSKNKPKVSPPPFEGPVEDPDEPR